VPALAVTISSGLVRCANGDPTYARLRLHTLPRVPRFGATTERFDMTRFAMLGLALALALTASAQEKKDVLKELAPFQGAWKVVSASRGGEAAPKDVLEKLSFAFEGDKMTVTEFGKAEAGSFSVDPKKTPAAIDIVGPKGEKVAGIYKFDKDGKLTLCFVKDKKDAVRPKGFDDKDAALIVLEKAKK
jgi:uncharacterized protein (TIGR03067 family)